MANARKANPDGYVHTRDAREYQRLRDQARMAGAPRLGCWPPSGSAPA